VKLRVSDEGIGIEADTLANILTLFYQIDGGIARRQGGGATAHR